MDTQPLRVQTRAGARRRSSPARPPWTTSESAGRSRVDSCFPLAEQPSAEAGPALLVFVHSSRLSRRDSQSRLRVEGSTADLALAYRRGRRLCRLQLADGGAASWFGAADRRPWPNRVRGREPGAGSPERIRSPAAHPAPSSGAPTRRAAGLEAREGFGLSSYGVTKMGGLRGATQLVSGVSGCRRNEAMIDWAQGDSGVTKCPTPGMLAIQEWGSVSAAA